MINYKELERVESWHQALKVVLEGARGWELDRVIILMRYLENNVLGKEQGVKESFMMGRSTKYKEDRFMIPLESGAGSQDQCISGKSVE
jgi:hypothetical protein